MLFVSGIAERRSHAQTSTTLAALNQARRSARSEALITASLGDVHLGYANGELARAEVGACVALLWRPRGEESSSDSAMLAACVKDYLDVGTTAFAQLKGAFVSALFDARDDAIVLVTDRFGSCPLYFAAFGERLLFATDADVIANDPECGRRLDPQALYDYVFFHCIPSPRTIYQGLHKLPPGSILRWHDATVRTSTWWQPRFARNADAAPELTAALGDRLERAVANRIRSGCGAFLSGGLDSSTVAAMLTRHVDAAPTFTIGFDIAGYDESGYARLAANHFQTKHHEYFVTPQDVRDSLTIIAADLSEPFGNSSVIPTYHCARFARESGVTLMLAGDGGDELFAGNTRYVAQRAFERYFSVPAALRSALEGAYRMVPAIERLPLAAKGASYIRQANMGLPDRLQSYNFLNRFEPQSVFANDWLDAIDTDLPWAAWRTRYHEPAQADAVQRMLYLDWKFTLADNDLVKVSRMCNLAGVEVCFPLLDTAVVDLSTALSGAALVPNGALRGFYKNACQSILPNAILMKSKHGFGLPFGVWTRTDRGLQDLVADAFSGMQRRGIFLPAFLADVLRLFRAQAPGYYGELVWLVTMLELWLVSHGH